MVYILVKSARVVIASEYDCKYDQMSIKKSPLTALPIGKEPQCFINSVFDFLFFAYGKPTKSNLSIMIALLKLQ